MMPFATAYPIVAWLSWVPNLVVAWMIVRRIKASRKVRYAVAPVADLVKDPAL